MLAPIGREIGFSEFQITSIIGVSALIVFLVSPFWGRLSDTWGRKRVMLIGLFGYTGGTLIFTIVLAIGLEGWLLGIPLYLGLIGARILHAMFMSAAMPASTAYMADITNVENRTKGMGASGAANNIGSMVGPVFAGLAAISLLLPLWLMAIIAFINGLFVWRYLPEPQRHAVPQHRPRRLKYTDPRILPFVVVGVCMFMGFALVQQTMGFRFQDALGLSATETAKTLGIAMMLSAACSLFSQMVVVQRLRLAPFTLLRIAIPLLIVAFVLMSAFSSQLMLTIAMMILGLGMGIAGPGFMSGASLAVSAEEQGAVAGVAGSCPPLGFFIGPMLGGALYQVNPVLPYQFAAGMYVLLVIAMIFLARRVTVHEG